MAQLKYHSAGLIESTNIIQKTFDHHTEVIEENELGSQYVNFTVPVKDLSDKITTVLGRVYINYPKLVEKKSENF